MGTDFNSIIKDAEGQLVKVLVQRIIQGLIQKLGWKWLSGWLGGPFGFVIGIVVGFVVKWGDLIGFHFANGAMNSSHAADLQEKGEALAKLPPTATKEEIQNAQKEKEDAFLRLWGADPN